MRQMYHQASGIKISDEKVVDILKKLLQRIREGWAHLLLNKWTDGQQKMESKWQFFRRNL